MMAAMMAVMMTKMMNWLVMWQEEEEEGMRQCQGRLLWAFLN